MRNESGYKVAYGPAIPSPQVFMLPLTCEREFYLLQQIMYLAKFLVILLVYNSFVCSYSHDPPISEASYKFFRLVLSIYSSESTSNLSWLQHGVIIRGDQRRPSSIDPAEYLQDDVILWDPLGVSSTFTLWSPNCLEHCESYQPLKATRWKDGKTKCDEPRRLYGLTKNVLLVSRVYICDRRHYIIANDPSVLSQAKGILPCPFVLFHRSGVSRELHRFIVSHAKAGLTISEIQSLWLQTMYDAYGLRREAYISQCCKYSKSNASFPEFEQTFQQPGEKIIASCIANNYFAKEHLYTLRMCQMTATKWLSCDHRLKYLQILDSGLINDG